MVVVRVERGGKPRRSRGARALNAPLRRLCIGTSIAVPRSSPTICRPTGGSAPSSPASFGQPTTGEFARRDPPAIATAHVNPAESFNAILKRAWVGVWHWFSIKHTHRYLDQIVCHWNHRKPTPRRGWRTSSWRAARGYGSGTAWHDRPGLPQPGCIRQRIRRFV